MPPIRYPLPTLIALVLLALLFWRGEAWTRSFRSALAARLARAVEGPPIPHSDRPQVVAGPIIRRALLLRDDVPVADRPGGPPSETIRHRMFVDIYDVWPLQGAPEHYRVGNRRAIGWVRGADLLPWDTRLVIRGEGEALPLADVPDHSPRPITIAIIAPRSGVAHRLALGRGLGPGPSLVRGRSPRMAAGIGLAGGELGGLALARGAPGPAPADARPGHRTMRESAEKLRLRALLGRLLDDRPLSDADVQAARAALPPPALAIAAGSRDEASDRLARVNEEWSAEASWGGVSFRFVPLEALP